jgi:hypothetical protein
VLPNTASRTPTPRAASEALRQREHCNVKQDHLELQKRLTSETALREGQDVRLNEATNLEAGGSHNGKVARVLLDSAMCLSIRTGPHGTIAGEALQEGA